MAGWSSDGDPKLLAAMCAKMCTTPHGSFIVTQDTIHLGNKFRNRTLKLNIHLPMGLFDVSTVHLQQLVKNIQKSVHGLSQIDVCPIDRMNFDSYEKITNDRVLEALQVHIQRSDATVQYLKIARDITSSFLEHDLSPTDRVFRIWHGVFFLRIWRQSILCSKRYTLKENFITPNAYVSSELNARNLICLIKKFRDEGKDHLFLPPIFDSQSCEKMFRTFRSMGTAQYTKINFSIYELMSMIGRVEVLNDIAYIKLADEKITFPNKRTGRTKKYSLPSDDEINETIAKAKREAIQNASNLGMQTNKCIDEYEFHYSEEIFNQIESSDEENSIEDIDETDDGYLTNTQSCAENSPFVIVLDENGVERKIRKSTYIWMLSEPSERISNDRLRRVQVRNE